jgi:DNA repair exonuclease SbcCD nuclease subunit
MSNIPFYILAVKLTRQSDIIKSVNKWLRGDKMIRLLHVADIHIGTKFAGRTEKVRNQLKKAVFSAFKKCVTYSIEHKLDGLIIAGDLFDSGQIPFHGEAGFIEEMKRLEEAQIHVFYTTGNHDPYRETALLKRLETFDYIHPFYKPLAETLDLVTRNGQAFKVTSAGHDGPHIEENIIATFPKKTGLVPHIGIGHTMVASVNKAFDHGNYMPCRLKDLEEKGYDYFALGHIHKAMALDEDGKIRYSGNIQGRHYKESGPKGGYLVNIENGITQTHFVAFHEIMWHQETVELSEQETTLYDVGRRIKETLKSVQDQNQVQEGQCICRIFLTGMSPLAKRLQEKEIIKELEDDLTMGLGLLDVRIKSAGLNPVLDRQTLKTEPHFLGTFLKTYDDNADVLKDFTREINFLSEKGQEKPDKLVEECFESLDKTLMKRIVK